MIEVSTHLIYGNGKMASVIRSISLSSKSALGLALGRKSLRPRLGTLPLAANGGISSRVTFRRQHQRYPDVHPTTCPSG